ncbi:MAG: DUF2325 domain-containing protein [Pseudomonadota bacterium]
MPHLPIQAPVKYGRPAVRGTAYETVFSPLRDACCTPVPAKLSAALPVRRVRLAELDANLHCSIIGTCLTTGELRKLVPRHVPGLDRKLANDLEIHHTAVDLSIRGGLLSKELNKALDTRHELTIKKFKGAPDEGALKALWRDSLANGEIPGAYWALMTHPMTTFEIRTMAFGDVHMLSHLVGASNRADIRRLVALEEECEKLKEQNGRQQTRLHEMSVQHEAAVRKLELQVAQLTAQCGQSLPTAPSTVIDEVAQLRHALADGEQKLSLHAARRNEAEQRALAHEESIQSLKAALQRAQEEAQAAHLEAQALEQALTGSLEPETGHATLPQLKGKCVLYVGGRPASSATLGKLVAAAGGELLVHDGGIEDRRGLLSAMLPRAHLVVFPIDCISHNAMHIAKQSCARHGIACHPLRTASVASFVELMQRLSEQEQAGQG